MGVVQTFKRILSGAASSLCKTLGSSGHYDQNAGWVVVSEREV